MKAEAMKARSARRLMVLLPPPPEPRRLAYEGPTGTPGHDLYCALTDALALLDDQPMGREFETDLRRLQSEVIERNRFPALRLLRAAQAIWERQAAPPKGVTLALDPATNLTFDLQVYGAFCQVSFSTQVPNGIWGRFLFTAKLTRQDRCQYVTAASEMEFGLHDPTLIFPAEIARMIEHVPAEKWIWHP